MVVRFGSGSSFGYDYLPVAVHGSYGDEIVAGDLQNCVDCRSCLVCGFSILGTVSFGSVHHCCKLGLYIPLRPVECVGGIELVRQNDRWIEKMLQELFGDDWDITQVFTLDLGGGEWYLLLRFLGDKPFQEGKTVMSPF